MTLNDDILACTSCPVLVAFRTHVVPARVGSLYKKGGIAILAEAPGAGEDKQHSRTPHDSECKGEPMVGRAGQLLDTVLQAAGISREHVVIMNTVRCRPPENRLDRHPEALLACDRWTKAELDEYDPGVVILTGNTPMRKIYGQQAKITAVRGKPRATSEAFEYGARTWLPTWHPAYCLRQPAQTATMLDDVKLGVELCR